jgi:Fe-S cluster assembly iron-binding protein IscA
MTVSLSAEATEHLPRDLKGRMLRIAFTTGCGGSGYRLSYADEPIDGDHLLDIGGIRVALDDMAASKLDGAVIEYDREEDGYSIDHPDAVSVVWCG